MNKPIIILGDLNCNALDSTCREYVALDGFTRELNLQQLIKQPTRIKARYHSSFWRFICPQKRDYHQSNQWPSAWFCWARAKISQAFSTLHISTKLQEPWSRSIYTWLSLAFGFLAPIICWLWCKQQARCFHNNVFRQVLDAHAPVKTIKIRNRPCPFITDDIKELMKTRDNLHHRFLQTRSETDWAEYKNYRNNVKRALIDAERKHAYQEVQSNKSSSRSLWKVTNNVVPSKSQEKHVYSKDLKTVANDLNSYFSSFGSLAADAVAQLAIDNNITYLRAH